MRSPNCRASSCPNPVAPIFGIDRPPVATTTEPACIVPAEVSSVNPSSRRPRPAVTLAIVVSSSSRTPASAHSRSSSSTRSRDVRSQNSCPSVFSWYGT